MRTVGSWERKVLSTETRVLGAEGNQLLQLAVGYGIDFSLHIEMTGGEDSWRLAEVLVESGG